MPGFAIASRRGFGRCDLAGGPGCWATGATRAMMAMRWLGLSLVTQATLNPEAVCDPTGVEDWWLGTRSSKIIHFWLKLTRSGLGIRVSAA